MVLPAKQWADATYAYDPNGNLATKTEGPDSWTYSWNAENQLTRVEKNGIEAARFAYDPAGRRVEKVAGGTTTSYTYDAEDILREVRGGMTLKYVHGPATDEPLAVDDGSALFYFHADGLGSIVRATNAAGAVTLTRQYDTWGNLEAGASEPGYAFIGREWDPEAGLYYFRARYVDAGAGRFVSEDPIGLRGGMNLYAYAHDSPVERTDPSGLCSCGPECTSGNWIMDLKGGGTAGAAFGSYAAGASVTYGSLRCMEDPTITRGVKVTCKIVHGFFLGDGIGPAASFTVSPDVTGKKCPEDLVPFHTTEKFFSIGPLGGGAPAGEWKILPTSLSFGKSFGAGVGMQECYVEPL